MFESEIEGLKLEFENSLKKREEDVWKKSVAIDEKVVKILAGFWFENMKLKKLIAGQRIDVRKQRYEGLVGLSDIEGKMDDLTKKIRRLHHVLQALVLELNSKKKIVVNSFLGYTREGKMILDWRVDDFLDEPAFGNGLGTSCAPHQNVSILESQVMCDHDSFYEDAYNKNFRNTNGSGLRDSHKDFQKKNSYSGKKNQAKANFTEKENTHFSPIINRDLTHSYTMNDHSDSFENELEQPVKNLSFMEINKKIRELADDPDIDIGIKHLSVADVKGHRPLPQEDPEIDSSIKLLNSNGVQRRMPHHGVAGAAGGKAKPVDAIGKNKKPDDVAGNKGKVAVVIKGGAKN